MDKNEYFMRIAIAARLRANCKGRKVGAVIVRDERVIATGYNGTAEGTMNCVDGGCVRCANRAKYDASNGYDVCVCVHAEQNALISSARFGNAVENSIIYSTMQPCFDCGKTALQSKIAAIYYLNPWGPKDPELLDQYKRLLLNFPGGVHRVEMNDPHDGWANGRTQELVFADR